MRYNIFTYSLKVWSTSIITGSLIFTVTQLYQKSNYTPLTESVIRETFGTFVFFCIAQFIFSFLIWVVYILFIKLLARYSIEMRNIKIWSTVLAIAATIFLFFSLNFFDAFNVKDPFLYVMLGDCFAIAMGSAIYKLKPI